MRRLTLRTQLTLLYAVPFLITGATLLSVMLLQTSDSVPAGMPVPPAGETGADEQRQLFVTSAFAFAGLVVVSFGLGWLIAGRFLRPLRTITATARDISASNLHRRLALPGSNEFTELGDTLDDLFARLEASFESQRRFVANASHELRTPLAAERALLQVALADPAVSVDSLRAAGQEVLALGAAQEGLIDALLTLASSDRGLAERVPFDLADVAADVLSGRREEAHRRGIDVVVRLTPTVVTGDLRLVESLAANLVDNAVRHNRAGGTVEVEVADGRLRVGNTGPVVPPEEVDRLFRPFERLGRPRVGTAEGHGLGLAIVRAIAGAHAATVTARPRLEGGLDIEVGFPGTPAASRPGMLEA